MAYSFDVWATPDEEPEPEELSEEEIRKRDRHEKVMAAIPLSFVVGGTFYLLTASIIYLCDYLV